MEQEVVVYHCIFERNKQLYTINNKIKCLKNDLELAEFEENLYYRLKEGFRYGTEFEDMYCKCQSKVDRLCEELKKLENEEDKLNIEINYLKKLLK